LPWIFLMIFCMISAIYPERGIIQCTKDAKACLSMQEGDRRGGFAADTKSGF
jgi:hypothetical protein